jgi:hypothetical protein
VASSGHPCAVCRTPLPADARFCPACGHPAEEDDTRSYEVPLETGPAPVEVADPGRVPVNVLATEPRYFGLTPPSLTFALAAVCLAIAAVFLAQARWLPGGLLLAAAVLLFALFLAVARRKPTPGVARVSARAATTLDAWFRFAVGAATSWSTAGREVMRLRQLLRALAAERNAVQYALGDAAYREDASAADALRTRMAEIDAELGRIDEAAREAIAATRVRVGRERVAIKRTERIVLAESEPDAGSEQEPAASDDAGRDAAR